MLEGQHFFSEIFALFLKNPVGQSIGLLAFLVSIINFVFLKDRKFIFATLVASIFWWVHFHIIWALTAAYINYFDILKNAVALKYERNKNWMCIFFLAYSLIWIWTFFDIDTKTLTIWKLNYFSLFPTFCALFSTFLVFKTRWIMMKWWFLIVVASWLVYNITYGSIGWVLTDGSLFIAWIVGIIKDLKNSWK